MRKTLGTLFLVSALVIAAIPVDNLLVFLLSSISNGASNISLTLTGLSIVPGYVFVSHWAYGGTVGDDNPGNGIFANQNNVKNLIVSPKFKGIGDYAFYNSGITTIKLENGLQCIGK